MRRPDCTSRSSRSSTRPTDEADASWPDWRCPAARRRRVARHRRAVPDPRCTEGLSASPIRGAARRNASPVVVTAWLIRPATWMSPGGCPRRVIRHARRPMKPSVTRSRHTGGRGGPRRGPAADQSTRQAFDEAFCDSLKAHRGPRWASQGPAGARGEPGRGDEGGRAEHTGGMSPAPSTRRGTGTTPNTTSSTQPRDCYHAVIASIGTRDGRTESPESRAQAGSPTTTADAAPPVSGRRTGPGPPVSAARVHVRAPRRPAVKAGGTAGVDLSSCRRTRGFA